MRESTRSVRERARQTVREIESFKHIVESLVNESATARTVWDELRPRVEGIEHDLEQLAESKLTSIQVEVYGLEEQWFRLQEPLTELFETVRDDLKAQHERHEWVMQRARDARSRAVRAARNTFDALAQNLNEIGRPRT